MTETIEDRISSEVFRTQITITTEDKALLISKERALVLGFWLLAFGFRLLALGNMKTTNCKQ